ncbi:MAG: heavy metal-responsive transcriptional regulator [Actinomycetota bacterium]|nr:heavy metal-responsive transcriptional regulator [Actinomycetota bacterium]
MRIGELAARVGVNPRTIRYYESIGLLPQPQRTAAGYRSYDEDDLDRLAFVRRATELDLQLDEIREILALREQGHRPCDYVLHVTRRHLDDLDSRIRQMQRARDELRALIARAGDLPDSGARYCPLIEHRRPIDATGQADSTA